MKFSHCMVEVLKFIDHDMSQLCTNLLKDERRIGLADQFMEQMLRIAQEKGVRLFVDLSDGLLNTMQQAQVVEVAQRQS